MTAQFWPPRCFSVILPGGKNAARRAPTRKIDLLIPDANMKRTYAHCRWGLALAVSFVFLFSAARSAESPGDTKPSSYAPAADLISQVDDFVSSLDMDLEDKDDYGEDRQTRVAQDASTLAAVALVLGKHDEKNKLQAAAPALIKASRDLADNASDYDAAKQALAEVHAALKSTGDGAQLEWTEVADLSLLMKQVPVVNNTLRRGVTGRRFERSVDKNAGHAATLAAIAQAVIVDTAYCADEAGEARWAEICIDMRDAAAEVSQAVRKVDQKAAEAALAKLVTTCDACHHEFRD